MHPVRIRRRLIHRAGLMLATGMPLSFAIGSSLVAVTAFGAATAASYAQFGLIDWTIAAAFLG